MKNKFAKTPFKIKVLSLTLLMLSSAAYAQDKPSLDVIKNTKQDSPVQQKISLKEFFNKFDPNDGVSKVTAHIQIASAQNSGDGLRFALTLTNNSDKEVEISNPLDYTSVTFISPQDKLLKLFPIDPPGLSDNVGGIRAMKPRFAFSVERVESGKTELSMNGFMDTSVTLPPKATTTFYIKVKDLEERVFLDLDTLLYGKFIPQPPLSFSSGLYKMNLRVTLVGRTEKQTPSLFRELQASDIPVQLQGEIGQVPQVSASRKEAMVTDIPVTEPQKNVPIRTGQVAPDFSVADMNGKVQRLSELKGKKHLLLTFFPKCFTGGCANHLSSLRDVYPQLQANDVEVLAVSVDPAEGEKGQLAFAKEWRLPFPLVPDTTRQFSMIYGAAQNDQQLASRMTVLIDKTGVVRWIDTDVQVNTHGADMLAKINELGLK